jgi:UDP-3-O-[3-hydroxymyristoyl] glucosamine N-acyltransferase
MLTFAESERFLRLAIKSDQTACVITLPWLADSVPSELGLAIAEDPKLAFRSLHSYLAQSTDFYWQPFSSQISPDAEIHHRAYVAEKNVQIGRGSRICANATILEGSVIGDGVVVYEGSVVGGLGLQTRKSEEVLDDLEHVGSAIVRAGARVLSNSVIARGLFRQATVIGEQVRLGNLAFVSHNVEVGARTIIGHGAVINGNARIGHDAWVGPSAVLSNGITVGDGAEVSLGSVVVKDVGAGKHVSGNFAVDHGAFLRSRRQG